MRRATGLAMARALTMYLLSVHCVANALLATDPRVPPLLPVIAIALLAAVVLGEALAPALAQLVDRVSRARLQITAWVPYGALLAISMMRLMNGDADAMAGLAAMFAALQGLFLLLAGFGRGYIGAIQNALVLTVFASLPGGRVASVGVTGFAGLLGLFLVFDHFARKLAAYPTREGPSVGTAFAQAAVVVLPVVGALALTFAILPPTGYEPLVRSARATQLTQEQVSAAYRDLAILAGAAGVVSWIVVWALLRGRGEADASPAIEVVTARRRGEEAMGEGAGRREPEYSGVRGRIVRTYLRFLERAAKLGLLRRPDMTPREFSVRVRRPEEPLAVLTDAFMRARWGPDEPAEEDARAAEGAAEAVVGELRGRRA